MEKGDLETQNAKLRDDSKTSQAEVDDGKMALAGFFEDSFQGAKLQVSYFYPDLDLSSLDSLKFVQDGELVDEP